MRATIFLTAFLMFGFSGEVQSQTVTCEEIKQEYMPQATPESTYQLELQMMQQGAYCYDISIFDWDWQSKAAMNSSGNHEFRRIAGYFDVPSKTFQQGKYAIIYYPDHKTLGPIFLYRENGKWVLDRSSVYKYIHYEDVWLAYDGDYPYLTMLKTIYPLEEKVTAQGQKVFKVR